MSPPFTIVERAYQLAKSGQFISIAQIRGRLRSEGYNSELVRLTLGGAALRRELKQLCDEAVHGSSMIDAARNPAGGRSAGLATPARTATAARTLRKAGVGGGSVESFSSGYSDD